MKDQVPNEEEPFEVSQVRARSASIALASPRSSPPRPALIVGKGLPTRACLGLAAAILTATPAAAPTTSSVGADTTNGVVEPPVGDAVVFARINWLTEP